MSLVHIAIHVVCTILYTAAVIVSAINILLHLKHFFSFIMNYYVIIAFLPFLVYTLYTNYMKFSNSFFGGYIPHIAQFPNNLVIAYYVKVFSWKDVEQQNKKS